MGWKYVLLVCVSLLPGHLLLQVSHQMVQRGHGKALQSTVYHGYHKGHTSPKKFTPFLHRPEEHHSFLSSSHEEYEHPSVVDLSSGEEYGPPPPAEYGPPPPAEYGPPPPAEYGPPQPARYGPPPPEEYGPLRPAEYGHPPPVEYGHPPLVEYGHPPPVEYGPPRPAEYGSPPPEEYGPPLPEEYGPPPTGDYKPLVVKNYIPHNVFTHFVNPATAEDYITHEQYGPPPPEEYGPPPPPPEALPALHEHTPIHEPTLIQPFVFYPDAHTTAHPTPPAPILSYASPQTHTPDHPFRPAAILSYAPPQTHTPAPPAPILSYAPPQTHTPAPPAPILPYAPPQTALKAHPTYPDDPPVYKYSYSVDDDYTGAVLSVEEARDQEYTHGSYQVSLPDGRMQSVQYSSDQYGGYKARVEYRDKYSSYKRS